MSGESNLALARELLHRIHLTENDAAVLLDGTKSPKILRVHIYDIRRILPRTPRTFHGYAVEYVRSGLPSPMPWRRGN
jgi:hypothetical protein